MQLLLAGSPESRWRRCKDLYGIRLRSAYNMVLTVPAASKTRNGWIYEIAQWYPRMEVYDDVLGWNSIPYQECSGVLSRIR